MHIEKTGIESSETKKRKMTAIRSNVVVAKSGVPTIRSGHIYTDEILKSIETQANNNPALFCSGVPCKPGSLILSEVCYQAKSFRIEENKLVCDLHRLDVNKHINTTKSLAYFHVYGVGDVNKQNQVTDFLLLGICTYSEPIYPA